jgi:hypothetical protein
MMILWLVTHSLQGQSRPGLEMFYYPGGRSLWSSLSTKLSYETVKGNYFELRRNYEQDGTIACSGGRSFSGKGLISWVMTPVAGFVAGKSQGLSLGLNTALEYKKLSFSSCIRQTASFVKGEPGFLFSWSELGYRFADHLAAGVVMQQTCLYRGGNPWQPGGNIWEPGGNTWETGGSRWEPGGMIALSFGGWAFPFYLFKSGGEAYSVAAGICYQ